MFEVAELGHRVSQQEYDERLPDLRERLLEAQVRIREEKIPVVILFAGVDGAGKGDLANLLSWWMDPRRITTKAYERLSTEEIERPEFWRFWRDLPRSGRIAVLLKAWYSKPLLQRAFERASEAEFQAQLDSIVDFERTLAENGTLVLKFWMHLGHRQQEERLKALQADPLTAWRVREQDWEHWRMYHKFVDAAEGVIARTSQPHAPWHIIEGTDPLYRGLEVGNRIVGAIERTLADRKRAIPTPSKAGKAKQDAAKAGPKPSEPTSPTVLSVLDLSKKVDKDAYEARLNKLEARLHLLHRAARAEGITLVLVFQGMDAAGKGGAIRRLTAALDARSCSVVSIGPPTEGEAAHHYLWRFWRLLPRAGSVIIFDRSWYGRVLVERIEGFATPEEWQRAYAEINEFERQLADGYAVIGKFWLQVSDEEQARRFEARAQVPYKRWKLTDEDWRNREKRPAYEAAVHDMVAKTSTPAARWTLIEADDKRYARLRVMEEVCKLLEAAIPKPTVPAEA